MHRDSLANTTNLPVRLLKRAAAKPSEDSHRAKENPTDSVSGCEPLFHQWRILRYFHKESKKKRPVIPDIVNEPALSMRPTRHQSLKSQFYVAPLRPLMLKVPPVSEADRNVRVVVLRGIDASWDLMTVLSQVRGGPLEKVRKFKSDKETLLVLTFMVHDHAMLFLAFAKTGLFAIHGTRLKVRLHKRHYTTGQEERQAVQWMHNGATRIICLSKGYPARRAPPRDKFPNPVEMFDCNVNVYKFWLDVAHFGTVIHIAPLFADQVAFSIHFADVESAVATMRAIERPDSLLRETFKGWFVNYGPDPTDRPCLTL